MRVCANGWVGGDEAEGGECVHFKCLRVSVSVYECMYIHYCEHV